MLKHPIHQTGPGALREAATRFIGQPQVPTSGVPGFVNRLYEVSIWGPCGFKASKQSSYLPNSFEYESWHQVDSLCLDFEI